MTHGSPTLASIFLIYSLVFNFALWNKTGHIYYSLEHQMHSFREINRALTEGNIFTHRWYIHATI